MAKIRAYPERWGERWYRDLDVKAKLLYDYIFDNVDWAGFIELDEPKFAFETGMSADEISSAIQALNSPLLGASEGLLLLKNFIDLQGNLPLNPDNNAHKNIITILRKRKKEFKDDEFFSSLEGADQPPSNVTYSKVEVDKEKKGVLGEKENDKFSDVYKSDFERARLMYPGSKRGLDTEFDYFKKKVKDWKGVLTLLAPAIKRQMDWRESADPNQFIPEWKDFKSWILNRYWEIETPKGLQHAPLKLGER